ncbi:hypothetical protein FA15DRAFT_670250 [Coprinopsis marcescibilis]|uniref:CREG-like beta-barrel domain-containing protein n=1 Tax=Coprinopsis marcescibilis TaxID=230819 RepID=A0A5C3KTA5_COPMA|nr:hypothetical protein FA15DRAFT_670250 [Coprinopsis marcescibilis]
MLLQLSALLLWLLLPTLTCCNESNARSALFKSNSETVYDAARIARTLVDNSKLSIGNMATIFPDDGSELSSYPFSMQEYYASCHSNGSLTLIFLPISRHSKNIIHGRPHAASISVTATVPAASRPRVSLLGNVTVFTETSKVPDLATIKECYLAKHPDARWWLPDDEDAAHLAYWARFDPHAVYFVGGFGGLHYIGYIPLEVYQEAKADVGLLDDSYTPFREQVQQ